MSLYFYVSVGVLALLLYFPTNKLIWVLGVRRAERKLQRKLSDAEVSGQANRAKFITILVVILFSWVFNLQLQDSLHG
jgi:hypothetical protein